MKVLKTEADFRNAHRELWQWLADNPKEHKDDWPGWADYAIICKNDCFACEFAGSCGHCPIWKHRPDETRRCMDYGSWYNERMRNLEPEGASENKTDLKKRRKYAELIRDAWPQPKEPK